MLRGARALRLPGHLPRRDCPPRPLPVPLPVDGGCRLLFHPRRALADRQLAAREAVLTDSRRIDMTLNLAADGSPAGDVTVRERLTGAAALEWREHVENQAQDKLRQELEQRALGFFFPGASLLDLRTARLITRTSR